MSDLTLYTYWRSSAAYRVRIALNLKGLSYQSIYVDLLKQGGENWQPEYRQINPQGLVPALVVDGQIFTQSLSIIEYLEEIHPNPALLPSDVMKRAYARSLAQIVACEIHPLNNLWVLGYLESTLAIDKAQRNQWYRHWIMAGFNAFEALLKTHQFGEFCHGDLPGLADAFLIPQVYNARRFNCELNVFPNITRIEQACLSLNAFQQAVPEVQADAIIY